jgi:MFS family permease
MFLMGFSTVAVGLLPTYDQVGLWAPAMLVMLRLIQGFAVAGEISGASSMILEHAPFGRRGFFSSFTLQGVQAGQIMAAAVFLPLAHYMPSEAFNSWGWRIPFLLSFIVIVAGYIIRREVAETPAFAEEDKAGVVPKAPVIQAVQQNWRDMLRVMCCSLMNVIPVVTTIFGAAYAVQPGYGIGFEKDIYLWIPVLGNIVAVLVIPFVGNLSDKIGRRPPIIIGALGSGLLSFGYLYAISIHHVPLAITMSLLMWGVVYQGYNAIFPSFYPEMFPTRTRVSGMAISQNLGTLVTALLPALFVAVAPPGATNIPLIIGSITLAICIVAAIAAWTARETYRVHMDDLGNPHAVPVPKAEYDRIREQVAPEVTAELHFQPFELNPQMPRRRPGHLRAPERESTAPRASSRPSRAR